MNRILETESTLTDRYQTTIPETVRDMLRLGKRDKLHYKIMSDGTVLLSHAESLQEADPVLVGFLALLAGDLAARPEAVLAMGTGRRARVRALTCGAAVDLDAPLDPADALNGQRQPGRGRQWLDHLRSSIVSEQLDALMAQVAALRQKTLPATPVKMPSGAWRSSKSWCTKSLHTIPPGPNIGRATRSVAYTSTGFALNYFSSTGCFSGTRSKPG